MKPLAVAESLIAAPALIAEGTYNSYVYGALNACLWRLPEGVIAFSSGSGLAYNDRQNPARQVVDIEQIGLLSNTRTVIDVTKGEFGRIVRIDAVRTRTGYYEHEIKGQDTLSLQDYKLETDGLSALGLIHTLQKIQRAARTSSVS